MIPIQEGQWAVRPNGSNIKNYCLLEDYAVRIVFLKLIKHKYIIIYQRVYRKYLLARKRLQQA